MKHTTGSQLGCGEKGESMWSEMLENRGYVAGKRGRLARTVGVGNSFFGSNQRNWKTLAEEEVRCWEAQALWATWP